MSKYKNNNEKLTISKETGIWNFIMRVINSNPSYFRNDEKVIQEGDEIEE